MLPRNVYRVTARRRSKRVKGKPTIFPQPGAKTHNPRRLLRDHGPELIGLPVEGRPWASFLRAVGEGDIGPIGVSGVTQSRISCAILASLS